VSVAQALPHSRGHIGDGTGYPPSRLGPDIPPKPVKGKNFTRGGLSSHGYAAIFFCWFARGARREEGSLPGRLHVVRFSADPPHSRVLTPLSLFGLNLGPFLAPGQTMGEWIHARPRTCNTTSTTSATLARKDCWVKYSPGRFSDLLILGADSQSSTCSSHSVGGLPPRASLGSSVPAFGVAGKSCCLGPSWRLVEARPWEASRRNVKRAHGCTELRQRPLRCADVSTVRATTETRVRSFCSVFVELYANEGLCFVLHRRSKRSERQQTQTS